MNCKQKFAADKQDSLSSNRSATEIDTNGSGQTIPLRHSAAFEEIWRTHAKQILRITRRITNNREDAEDALQDSFLRAHVHLHDFDGRSSIATWLTRIAINSALMILRKRTGAAQVSIENVGAPGAEALALIPADQAPSPEAQYADLEQQAIFRSAIRGTTAFNPPGFRTPSSGRTIIQRNSGEHGTLCPCRQVAAVSRQGCRAAVSAGETQPPLRRHQRTSTIGGVSREIAVRSPHSC